MTHLPLAMKQWCALYVCLYTYPCTSDSSAKAIVQMAERVWLIIEYVMNHIRYMCHFYLIIVDLVARECYFNKYDQQAPRIDVRTMFNMLH